MKNPAKNLYYFAPGKNTKTEDLLKGVLPINLHTAKTFEETTKEKATIVAEFCYQDDARGVGIYDVIKILSPSKKDGEQTWSDIPPIRVYLPMFQ